MLEFIHSAKCAKTRSKLNLMGISIANSAEILAKPAIVSTEPWRLVYQLDQVVALKKGKNVVLQSQKRHKWITGQARSGRLQHRWKGDLPQFWVEHPLNFHVLRAVHPFGNGIQWIHDSNPHQSAIHGVRHRFRQASQAQRKQSIQNQSMFETLWFKMVPTIKLIHFSSFFQKWFHCIELRGIRSSWPLRHGNFLTGLRTPKTFTM